MANATKYGAGLYGVVTYGGWQVPIYDRTAADVQDGTAKGYYTRADINRVGHNVEHFAALLNLYGYHVTVIPKTDWAKTDFPVQAAMVTYLSNVQAMIDAYVTLTTTPALPVGMDLLTWAKANNIEKILLDMKALLESMLEMFLRSGIAVCGTSNLYFAN